MRFPKIKPDGKWIQIPYTHFLLGSFFGILALPSHQTGNSELFILYTRANPKQLQKEKSSQAKLCQTSLGSSSPKKVCLMFEYP